MQRLMVTSLSHMVKKMNLVGDVKSHVDFQLMFAHSTINDNTMLHTVACKQSNAL